jgi:hypothetical protein
LLNCKSGALRKSPGRAPFSGQRDREGFLCDLRASFAIFAVKGFVSDPLTAKSKAFNRKVREEKPRRTQRNSWDVNPDT